MAQQMSGVKRILEDIGVDVTTLLPFPVYSDSKGAIAQGNNPVSNSSMTHLDNKVFYCRQQKNKGQVSYTWIARRFNPADIGTHVMSDHLGFERFVAFLRNSGVVRYTRSSST